jgi:thioredoxin reductase
MGGQLTTTTEVDNFPGYADGITGPEMMDDLKKQSERFGAEVRFGIATAADFSGTPHRVTIDDNKIIEADAVIIATGATAKYLGLESEIKYAGMGVSAQHLHVFTEEKMLLWLEGETLRQKKQPTWPVYAIRYILLSEEMF